MQAIRQRLRFSLPSQCKQLVPYPVPSALPAAPSIQNSLTRSQRSASSATLAASVCRLASVSSCASTAEPAGARSEGKKNSLLRRATSCGRWGGA